MSDIDHGSDEYVELEEGDEEVGAPTPNEVMPPGEGEEEGGNFAGSEVSPAGGVDDADVGGDLGEGVEDHKDERAPAKTERQLDKHLKETFPSSDPMPANPGAD